MLQSALFTVLLTCDVYTNGLKSFWLNKNIDYDLVESVLSKRILEVFDSSGDEVRKIIFLKLATF